MKKYTLLFLTMYLMFILIPIDVVKDGYYYFIGTLFAGGVTAKFWLIPKKIQHKMYWGNFREYDHCNECDHLQEFSGGFNGVCPSCGSNDVKKVVARWQSYNVSIGMAGFKVVRNKSEVLK